MAEVSIFACDHPNHARITSNGIETVEAVGAYYFGDTRVDYCRDHGGRTNSMWIWDLLWERKQCDESMPMTMT